MPNDAKLGLVVGVTLVILVAVVFFRKDATVGAGSLAPAPANGVRPALPSPPPANGRAVTASPTAQEPGTETEPSAHVLNTEGGPKATASEKAETDEPDR